MGKNAKRSLMKRSRSSEQEPLPTFDEYVDTDLQGDPIFHDQVLKDHLQAGKITAARDEEALRRLRSQISIARGRILYPGQTETSAKLAHGYQDAAADDQAVPNESNQKPDDAAQSPEIGGAGQQGIWSLIISDAGNTALDLRDAFNSFWEQSRKSKDQTDRLQVRLRAERVVRALQYMLRAILYQLRASTNESVGSDGHSALTQRELADKFRENEKMIEDLVRKWRIGRALPRGELEAVYAADYNAWSRDFNDLHEDELGWGRFARYISSELRFRHYSFQLRQRWKEVPSAPIQLMPLRFIWALFVQGFKWTTGFGLKPVRFAVTTFLTLVTFTLLYFVNDLYTGLAVSPKSVMNNLYVAVVYLTSVGTDHPPAGFAPALIGVESILGYFLLSVLAAMLFAWFTDR